MATNTVSYFQSSLLAQEMENTWKGTVRFNAGQALTESEKAQARENIGAVPFGSNLKILGHFDTANELESSAPRNVGDAYSVGTTTPYNLYIYDGLSEEWKDYGQIRATDISTRYIENQSVAVAGWTADTTVFADYTYKAQITMNAATADDFPIISFEPTDAASGNFCPVAFAFDGYLEIWAKEIPAAAINIPVATIIVNGGNGRGITNATPGITAGSIDADDIANGVITAAKLAPGATHTDATVTLTAAGWSSNTQTVDVSNVKADSVVIVSPAPESFKAYGEAGIYCSAQAEGKLTFTCDSVPTAAITVNVVIPR